MDFASVSPLIAPARVRRGAHLRAAMKVGATRRKGKLARAGLSEIAA
jgi:hypothetical protein